MITDYTKGLVIQYFGGSPTIIPTSLAFGVGSSIVSGNNTTLSNGSLAILFTSKFYPAFNKITFQTDGNSVQMSGLQLREFGVISGLRANGSIFDRTVIPALTFDGTNEIQVQTTWEIY
jgi:hypothetical protein